MRKTLVFLFLLTLVILTGSASAEIVKVGFSGDGADYTCDGSADDVQIQQALDRVAGTGGTVYLIGGNTYVISKTLEIGDNTILTGDSDAVIKLKNNARWDKLVPMIENSGSSGNIKIHGFEIDANYYNNVVGTG
ncbi:MAG: hypothetical protein R2741_14055 [Methanolobus sp.]